MGRQLGQCGSSATGRAFAELQTQLLLRSTRWGLGRRARDGRPSCVGGSLLSSFSNLLIFPRSPGHLRCSPPLPEKDGLQGKSLYRLAPRRHAPTPRSRHAGDQLEPQLKVVHCPLPMVEMKVNEPPPLHKTSSVGVRTYRVGEGRWEEG